MNSESKINSYLDLQVWQRSHKLASDLYKISKKKNRSFSDLEIWRQVLRSSFSAPANICEGFYSHRGKNFASHLEIARGSLGETDYWVLVLAEFGQIDEGKALLLRKECQEIIAMLTSFIKKIKL